MKSCFSYLIGVFVLAGLGVVPAAGNVTGPAVQANEYSWRQETNSVALLNRGKVVWQLNYDKAEGKPYFHPLSTVDGSVLSWLRPNDHPWHRALWFSWKYIDGLNYWEEDGNTGLSAGRTELTGVKVSAAADFSARIEMTLSYHPPEKEEVLSEKRVVEVSAPQADGCYRIDWVSRFVTAASNAVLGRTPIPGETNGVEYGGYAGLSLRMAKETQGWTFVDSEGREGAAIHGKKSEWVNVSGNFAEGRGGVAIFSHPANVRQPSSWYVAKDMPYFSPAVLFDEPLVLEKGKVLELKYRILVHGGAVDRDFIGNEWKRYADVLSPALLSATTPVPAIAEGFSLHNLFQSNMVLQREKPITIWGWAVTGEDVAVSFGGQTQTTKADADRLWKVIFPAMPATAEPLQMTIRGKDATITLDNILIGDVWVVGGQSNMQEPLVNLEGGDVEIASANFPRIRLLTVPSIIDNKEKKNFPRRQKDKQPDGDWDICSPKTVPEFSGIGYIFARRIHMASQIPIGVIDASYWGTTVESWTPLSVVKAMDNDVVRALISDWDKQVAAWDPKKQLENQIKQHEQRMEELKKQGKTSNEPPPSKPGGAPIDNQNHPGNCYASMIAPIAGLAVKGAVWHQGYNNARPDAETFYYQVFPKMIASWRAAFNDATMPFGIISLCTDTTPQTLDNYLECMMDFGIYVREAQYKTFLDFYKAGDKNIGYASSYDHRRAWWHPELKIPAAERIARWAMATQYGVNSVNWKPPMITKMETKDNTLILNFDSDVSSVNSEAIAGFSIAGKDGKFQPAKAEWLVTGKNNNGQPEHNWKALVLSHPLVPNPIHFRFAWGRNPMGNLRMVYIKDIPLGTQRSDNWTVADMYENYTGKKSAVPGQVHGGEVEELKQALKAADLERRIFEARALLEAQK